MPDPLACHRFLVLQHKSFGRPRHRTWIGKGLSAEDAEAEQRTPRVKGHEDMADAVLGHSPVYPLRILRGLCVKALLFLFGVSHKWPMAI